jgi:hypothetical protein
MSRKTFIQFFFVLLIIITLGVFYYYYKNDKKISIINAPIATTNEKIQKNENNNYIKRLEYSTTDLEGNSYNITSKSGQLDLDNPDIITMLDVNAKIILADKSLITIKADFANYNSINYNTNFNSNVSLKYEDHNVNSDKLDFFFNKNQILMSGNIIYKSSLTEMYVDILEIDLITKNSRLLMYNQSDKIMIKGQINNGNN